MLLIFYMMVKEAVTHFFPENINTFVFFLPYCSQRYFKILAKKEKIMKTKLNKIRSPEHVSESDQNLYHS